MHANQTNSVKLWHIHEIRAGFSYFLFISQHFAQILKYFAQSSDCMIADFRKSVSCVTCHKSPVTCHLPPVTCYKRQQPQPQTFPLLNPPLCTVGCFAKTQKPEKCLNSKIIKMTNKKSKNIWRHAIISKSLFDQKSPIRREVGFPQCHTHTYMTDRNSG